MYCNSVLSAFDSTTHCMYDRPHTDTHKPGLQGAPCLFSFRLCRSHTTVPATFKERHTRTCLPLLHPPTQDKHNQNLYQGPTAGWTSGVVGDDMPARLPYASASHNTPQHHPRPAPGTASVKDSHPAKNRRFHTITVTPDSHYTRWQMQIHYYW